jgi:hypothetical protein
MMTAYGSELEGHRREVATKDHKDRIENGCDKVCKSDSDQMIPTAASFSAILAILCGWSGLDNNTDDARHVAVCPVAHLDYLVSWNFRHLANVRRESGLIRARDNAPLAKRRGSASLPACLSMNAK